LCCSFAQSNQLVDAFTLVALLVRNLRNLLFFSAPLTNSSLVPRPLQDRGVRKIEVSISEANQQFASYERTILE
jgi:hypothetical protein